MAKLKYFHDIELNKSLKRQMIGVAVSIGTVSAFGTPFGGIISAIELTSTFYMVRNLWKCFLCSILTLIIFFMLPRYNYMPMFS
jgi:H+/Cl- antiporter ClcA